MNFSNIFKLLVVFLIFSQLLAQEQAARTVEKNVASTSEEPKQLSAPTSEEPRQLSAPTSEELGQLSAPTEAEKKLHEEGNNLRFLPQCRLYGTPCVPTAVPSMCCQPYVCNNKVAQCLI